LIANVTFITNADVEDLFEKCTKLCTTNNFSNPNARRDLLELYSKIYGSNSSTNNKFSSWLVKGYIANIKKKKVNWALTTSTTTLEKANRVQWLLLCLLNPKSSDNATTSSLKHSTCTSQQEGISTCSIGVMVKTEGMTIRLGSTPLSLGFSNLCPYKVSLTDLDPIWDVSVIEHELFVIATSKVNFLIWQPLIIWWMTLVKTSGWKKMIFYSIY